MSRKQAELFGAFSENYGALPEGFVFQPDFITVDEERARLEEIARLPLEAAKYKQYTARRRIAYFGFGYDFTSNRLGEAPPAPEFLAPLRDKVAAWMGVEPAELEQALVTEYRPGTPLGWHRDAPAFGTVAGVSLGSACRMRFRPYSPAARVKGAGFMLHLEPRSAYVLRDDARWRWQHSVPPTPGLRYSITFRTLRRRGAR